MKLLILPLIFINSILYSQQENLNYFPNKSSLTLINPAFSIDKSSLSNITSFGSNYNRNNIFLGINKNKNNFSLIHSNENSSSINSYNLNNLYTSLQYSRLIKLSEHQKLNIGTEFRLQQFSWNITGAEFRRRYLGNGLGIKYINQYFFLGSSYKITNNFFLDSFYGFQAGTNLKIKELTLSTSILYSRYNAFFNDLHLMFNINYKWLNIQSGYKVNDQFSLGARIDLKDISFGYVFSEYTSKLTFNTPSTHSFNVLFKISHLKKSNE